jgi:hypothetical protein
MATFLDLFPKIPYDIEKALYRSKYDVVTDITFRFGFVKELLNNISAYYLYSIKDTETPEILAEYVYDNPEAYWIILYANDIYDPQYDWPLNYSNFQNYIISKYGSIAASQTGIHHYEKIITRTESLSGTVTEQRIIVNYDKLTNNALDIPYDYYVGLPAGQSVETINMNGQTVTEVISRSAVSKYDYEDQENEKKRTIKIIKPEYYQQIMLEFDNMTNNSITPYLRKFTTNKFMR